MKNIIVSAALLVKDHKIFIAQRPANKLPPLVWEFPGGKQEPGEELFETLHRELQEELSIDTKIGNFITKVTHKYQFATVEINLFYAYMQNPNDKIIDTEHHAIKWVDFADIDNYQFADGDKELIQILKRTDLNI